MEGEGLVTSKWKTSAHGPARRQYHITGRGISALHEMSAQLVRLKGQIESFLSRYKALKGENISE